MRKAQIVFENFMLAIVFIFMLASSVFVVLGGGGGLDIDFFSPTIHSEPIAGLDLAFLTIYEDGDLNNFKQDNYHYYENNKTTYYSFRRTETISDEYPMKAEFYIAWDYCNSTSCFNKTNSYSQAEPEYTIGAAQKLRQYYYEYTIPDEIYSDCESNLILGVEIEDDMMNETIIDNNYYYLSLDHCFYPPTDLSIVSASEDSKILQVDLINEYNTVPFKLLIELKDITGEYHELDFDHYAEERGSEDLYHGYNQFLEIGPEEEITLNYDLSNSRTVLWNHNLIQCDDGEARITIQYEEDEKTYYLKDDDDEIMKEYDDKNNIILTNEEERFLIFQEPGFNKKVYSEGGLNQVRVKSYEDGEPLLNVGSVPVTHEESEVSQYRSFDKLPILHFDNNGVLQGPDFSCQPVTIGDDTCYCSAEKPATVYNCGSAGTFTEEGLLLTGDCVYEKVYFTLNCPEQGIENNELDECTIPPDTDCTCTPYLEELDCTCSTTTYTDYLICDNELYHKNIIEYETSRTITRDEDLSNNQIITSTSWCLQ